MKKRMIIGGIPRTIRQRGGSLTGSIGAPNFGMFNSLKTPDSETWKKEEKEAESNRAKLLEKLAARL